VRANFHRHTGATIARASVSHEPHRCIFQALLFPNMQRRRVATTHALGSSQSRRAWRARHQ
jgi:hypothetical protein